MRRAIVRLIALPGLAAAVAATIAFAATQFETATYAISGSVASVIGEHARWNEACRALDAPLVTLERAAGHGAVCIRHDVITSIQTRSGRAANCIGRRLNGVLVIYQPRPGFSGADSLRYGLDFPEGHVSREIVIEIQPGSGARPAFPLDLPPNAAPRAGDRLPECAGESS